MSSTVIWSEPHGITLQKSSYNWRKVPLHAS